MVKRCPYCLEVRKSQELFQLPQFTPAQLPLIEALADAMPDIVSRYTLMKAVYGPRGNSVQHMDSLGVWVHNLRQRLKGTPTQINTYPGEGFSLTMTEEKQ